MKLSVLGIALSMLFFTSCKKDEVVNPPFPSMESGIYSGKYIAQSHGVNDTRFQFRLSITQVNDSTYNIQQVDLGDLPPFKMVYGATLGTGTNTKLKFRIPIQMVDGQEIVGDARVTNSYDGLYYSFDKSINFGIVIDGNPLDYIRFTGIKE